MKKIKISKELLSILISNNIKPVLVGGYVRDFLMEGNVLSKDIDIELYTDKNYEELINILKIYSPKEVGKNFGVIKIDIGDDDFDLSLPRTESSIGDSHTDFDIEVDGQLSYKDAFKRRDFTMNAIGYDLEENNLIDIYNGQRDIKNKIIRHVNTETFIEDPLRIYRAIQFSSRFNFKIAPETNVLINAMIYNNDLDALPKERIFIEFNKILLKSEKPSIGFELMRSFGIIKKYFPELDKLIGVPQSPKWHPEGDVWIHTMMVIDEMARFFRENPGISEEKKIIYIYACLSHDLGKPYFTTIDNEGNIRSSGHEEGGIIPTQNFMNRLTNSQDLISKVCGLVEFHIRPSILYSQNSKLSTIKRLSNKLIDKGLTLEDLAIVNYADSLGRTTEIALNREVPQYNWIIDKFKNHNLVKKEKALIDGRDLINEGLKPGENFGLILNSLYDFQIENNITNKKDIVNELKKELKKYDIENVDLKF